MMHCLDAQALRAHRGDAEPPETTTAALLALAELGYASLEVSEKPICSRTGPPAPRSAVQDVEKFLCVQQYNVSSNTPGEWVFRVALSDSASLPYVTASRMQDAEHMFTSNDGIHRLDHLYVVEYKVTLHPALCSVFCQLCSPSVTLLGPRDLFPGGATTAPPYNALQTLLVAMFRAGRRDKSIPPMLISSIEALLEVPSYLSELLPPGSGRDLTTGKLTTMFLQDGNLQGAAPGVVVDEVALLKYLEVVESSMERWAGRERTVVDQVSAGDVLEVESGKKERGCVGGRVWGEWTRMCRRY